MLIKRSTEQARINTKIAKREAWLWENEPICIFCLQPVYNGQADPCHKIRRSWASRFHTREELQTMDMNIGLGHRECHEMFDNEPTRWNELPGIDKILAEIKIIDLDYYRIVEKNLSII